MPERWHVLSLAATVASLGVLVATAVLVVQGAPLAVALAGFAAGAALAWLSSHLGRRAATVHAGFQLASFWADKVVIAAFPLWLVGTDFEGALAALPLAGLSLGLVCAMTACAAVRGVAKVRHWAATGVLLVTTGLTAGLAADTFALAGEGLAAGHLAVFVAVPCVLAAGIYGLLSIGHGSPAPAAQTT